MIDYKHFDFGKNWQAFSENALSESKVNQASEGLARLLEGVPLSGKSFLDIGFGQGLSLLLATRQGARTFGNDINPLCADVLAYNRQKFPDIEVVDIPVVVGSILNSETVAALKAEASEGLFDIVHSWGVLHHTGEIWKAIDTAAQLVKPGGVLVLAIYNRHWTAPIWSWIKRLFNVSPRPVQTLLVWGYMGLFAVKSLLAGENPVQRQRGMDFYYDAVDWVGGYPYEYASRQEIESYLGERGFGLVRFFPTEGFTGCNEFVFRSGTSEA